MAAPGTKQVLLSLIEDVEIITKELFELMSAKKTETSTEPVADTGQLMELLLKKDAEIQAALKTATEQGEVQKKIEALQVEVDRRDADILQLQKNLKEAETILATAIYQAKQKLTSIKQANQKSIPSEELIKYAHKISSSHAVAAPNTWQPGDPRRPYPTELDMRMGFLGRLNNPNFQSQPGLGADPQLSRQPGQLDHTPSHAASMPWQPPPELSSSISMATSNQAAMSEVKGLNKENEDVEVMSTDSSSSSSSDESRP